MHAKTEVEVQRGFPVLFFFLLSLLAAVVYVVLFLWIASTMDRLIVERQRATAKQLVDSHLLAHHMNVWETEPDKQELVRKMGEGLQMQSYLARIIEPGDQKKPNRLGVFPPETKREEAILEQLRNELRDQMSEGATQGGEPVTPADDTEETSVRSTPEGTTSLVPVYRERFAALSEDPDTWVYHYYQPVYWKRSCELCHRALTPGSAFASAHEAGYDAAFRVVRVSIPEPGIRSQQVSTRARLIVAGLLAYLVTIIGSLILLVLVGGRRNRRLPAGGQPADPVPADLAEQ